MIMNTWNSHQFFEDPPSAEYFLGILDTVFMTAYAMGLFISGIIGDRYNMRVVLSIGMWLSALTVFLFGTLSEWLHIYNEYYYGIFWFLNGLFQSSGWPITVTIMGNWFGKANRGIVFGVWGACTSVGNIIGSYLVASVLIYGYQWAFLVPACLLFAGGIVIFFTLVASPTELGLPLPDNLEEEEEEEVEVDNDRDASVPLLSENCESGELLVGPAAKEEPVTFWNALCLPGVLAYSLAYACLKMVNYSFFFWLPYYLTVNFKWDQAEADKLSTWYDFGGIAGAIVSGYISDKMKRRTPTVMVMLIISPITLLIYSASPADKTTNAILMSLVGIFVNGAANIVSTAVAADLGRQPVLRGNSKALSTVTGIIDGTGSFGAAMGMLIIPVVSKELDWKYVFYLFIIMMLLTAICICPIFIRDAKYYWIKLRSQTFV
uniref:Sugar phosphate exchanger 3 n=1 Tax=Strigamia maritima TaxID=126957 RepID=T1JIF4_STRMM